HLDHADPGRPDALPGAGQGRRLGVVAVAGARHGGMNVFSRQTPEARGLGMTSQRARDRLVERLKAEGIAERRVLGVIGRLPRHLFVEEALASRAYEDTALPIGLSQTISQPYVVALMTQAAIEGRAPEKALEIGTGSGYQAAVLAALVKNVYTVERIE